MTWGYFRSNRSDIDEMAAEFAHHPPSPKSIFVFMDHENVRLKLAPDRNNSSTTTNSSSSSQSSNSSSSSNSKINSSDSENDSDGDGRSSPPQVSVADIVEGTIRAALWQVFQIAHPEDVDIRNLHDITWYFPHIVGKNSWHHWTDNLDIVEEFRHWGATIIEPGNKYDSVDTAIHRLITKDVLSIADFPQHVKEDFLFIVMSGDGDFSATVEQISHAKIPFAVVTAHNGSLGYRNITPEGCLIQNWQNILQGRWWEGLWKKTRKRPKIRSPPYVLAPTRRSTRLPFGQRSAVGHRPGVVTSHTSSSSSPSSSSALLIPQTASETPFSTGIARPPLHHHRLVAPYSAHVSSAISATQPSLIGSMFGISQRDCSVKALQAGFPMVAKENVAPRLAPSSQLAEKKGKEAAQPLSPVAPISPSIPLQPTKPPSPRRKEGSEPATPSICNPLAGDETPKSGAPASPAELGPPLPAPSTPLPSEEKEASRATPAASKFVCFIPGNKLMQVRFDEDVREICDQRNLSLSVKRAYTSPVSYLARISVSGNGVSTVLNRKVHKDDIDLDTLKLVLEESSGVPLRSIALHTTSLGNLPVALCTIDAQQLVSRFDSPRAAVLHVISLNTIQLVDGVQLDLYPARSDRSDLDRLEQQGILLLFPSMYGIEVAISENPGAQLTSKGLSKGSKRIRKLLATKHSIFAW